MIENQIRPPNSFHKCGSSSYGSLIARDEHGVIQPTGVNVCNGCKAEFTDINEWRLGAGWQLAMDRS